MKRRLGVITALLCLCGAGAAFAAGPVSSPPNSYTGSFTVSGAAGTAAKPAAVAMTETLGMSSTTSGNVGAPLTDIKTTTYGVKAPNGGEVPEVHLRRSAPTTATTASGTPSARRARWSPPAASPRR